MQQQLEERRRDPRVVFTGTVVVRVNLRRILGDARNLSATGMSLQTYRALEGVETFVTRFALPCGDMVEIDSRVVYQIPWEDWNVVGVEFLDVPGGVEQTIGDLVDEGAYDRRPRTVRAQG